MDSLGYVLPSASIQNAIDLPSQMDPVVLVDEIKHQGVKFVLAALLLSLFVVYLQSLHRSTTSVLSKIPGPWYASLTALHLRYLFARGTIWKYAARQHRQYGSVIRLGPRQIWVSDKEALNDILLKVDLPKVTMYAEISRDRNSPGLFGEIRPEPHKKLKRFLGPAFTISSVDSLDYYFKNCVLVLLQNYYSKIQSPSPHQLSFETDLMRDLHCLALDIMGESAFGKGFGQIDKVFDSSKVKTQRDREWSKIPDAIFKGLANRYRFVFVKRFFRRIGIQIEFDWPKEMIKAISALVDDRKSDEKPEIVIRKDVLQHMLDEGNRPDTGVRMSNRDIIDQMSELLLAGSETTSGTLGCPFLEIARNPAVKAKLLASLPVLGPEDLILTSKTVRDGQTYAYLEACIKENLRMHPIASEMGRRTMDQGFRIKDYEIPPYTVVSASYRQLHLDENHWPQADRFWPERWLGEDEREGAPEPDMDAYYPFSAGKHSCIGQNFAYAEIRTVSVNILSRFDVKEVDHKVIDFRQFITMQFHDGSWKVRLIPRERNG